MRFFQRGIRLLVVLACLCAGNVVFAGEAAPAARSLEQQLVDGDASARAALIVQAAAASEPRLTDIIVMMEAGRLLISADGRALVQQPDGSVRDPQTHAVVPVDPATLNSVTVNNRVRGAIAIARAAQQLAADDAGVRLQAARALQGSETPALLPLIDRQLAQESNGRIAAALSLVQASLRLSSADAELRKLAIDAFAQSADPNAVSRLRPFTDAVGESDPVVRAAAQESIAAIERRMAGYDLLGNVFSGLSLGSVLLLAALGLAITYGLLGVINMAHGEMLMLGAYTTFVVQNLFQSYLSGFFGWYLLAAVPAAFLTTAMIGMLLERTVIRYLYGRPLETLLATWGISLLLIQVVRMVFGAQNVTVENPGWLSGGWELSPVLTLPYNRIVIILFVIFVLAFTWILLQKTRLGLFVRAVTQNRRMADSVGVPTGRVDMMAFGLGSGIAGLGGVALSQLGNVGPELGQAYIVDSFMVVVLGGVGQLAGTVIGAMGLGIVNKILEPQVGAVLGKIAILVFIILFIQKRPQGLFALKGRQVD
ncbi:MAG: urea ABC transporter permease subunit UrtB [Pseudomonadota bacterium]